MSLLCPYCDSPLEIPKYIRETVYKHVGSSSTFDSLCCDMPIGCKIIQQVEIKKVQSE